MKYINAEDLRKAMYEETFEKDSEMQKWESGCWIRYKLFENVLDAIPSADVVEVVRCKDCGFFDKKRNGGLKEYGYCEIYKGYKKADGFCDEGERKTDD